MEQSLEPQWCDKMNVVEPKPFLKWAGGKRQLLNDLLSHLPYQFNNYYEPFLGGGALFFKLSSLGKIKHAYLNDNNKILIDAYRTIKENPHELIKELENGKYINNKEIFYKIRQEKPIDVVESTARFLYLNKTAFNGLYRVNSKGIFNVPFGKYSKPTILDKSNLWAVNKALQTNDLSHLDFEEAVDGAKNGDLVYFDPPYHPISKTANFTGYIKDIFSLKDQQRLARKFNELDKRGCKIILSNSHSPLILELYNKYHIDIVRAVRMINCKADGRGLVKEVIITNYSDYLSL